uniref:Uncharacterized protein n=1 Tax=Arcella intermedia TaxID=1963864 RepID=A0A6B2LWJ5_9EUKA
MDFKVNWTDYSFKSRENIFVRVVLDSIFLSNHGKQHYHLLSCKFLP